MSLDREVGEIKVMLKSVLDLLEKQNGRVGVLETDVSTLRRFQALVIGMFATAGTGIGAAVTKFLN